MHSCLAEAGSSSAAYPPLHTRLEEEEVENEGRKDEKRRRREKGEAEESRKWIEVE